ncbi:MAG: thymidine phosphorylase [Nitriliruptorales bacterium]
MTRFPPDTRALITRKRHGGHLESHEISELIAAFMAGKVGEEQMSALLMAGVVQGFSEEEAISLTEALVASGAIVDLQGLPGPTVDKHSTGGVGDTTTLVVGPLVAACGARMAKLSGRALGHTGGTLDKLAAVPGFRSDLDERTFRDQVERIGLAIAAASQELVPADKHLYDLRDRTATVESPALIAASVMSKKIAGGAQHIVLDVKTGGGAFVSEPRQGGALARLCTRIGQFHKRRVAALVTDMSQPVGAAVGNALEVAAAVAVLQGEERGRLWSLSLELATTLLTLTGRTEASARDAAEEARSSGRALEKFGRLIEAQGGSGGLGDDPWRILPTAAIVCDWKPRPGIVTGMDCRGIGELAHALGAGRRGNGMIDPAVGLEVFASLGDEVGPDPPPVRVHARSRSDAEQALVALERLVLIGEGPAEIPPLVFERVLS